MSKVLILFAHPRLEKSRTNRFLLDHIPAMEGITLRDLYELYPDFNIDIAAEKALLLEHDLIVWHHPFYWYSAPPLLKQWIDLVLEFGWAYGPGGNQLYGKYIFNAISTGGAAEAYTAAGRNRYTIREYLRPFEQTAHLCQMVYLPPFLIQGTHRQTTESLEQHAWQYYYLLTTIAQGQYPLQKMLELSTLNELMSLATS